MRSWSEIPFVLVSFYFNLLSIFDRDFTSWSLEWLFFHFSNSDLIFPILFGLYFPFLFGLMYFPFFFGLLFSLRTFIQSRSHFGFLPKFFIHFENQKNSYTISRMSLQGQPIGFDTQYLALADTGSFDWIWYILKTWEAN